MDKLTGADVRGFFVVAAALVVFLVGVLNLVKSWRDLRKPPYRPHEGHVFFP